MTEKFDRDEFDVKTAKMNDYNFATSTKDIIDQSDQMPEKFEIVEVEDYFVNLTKDSWLKSKFLIHKNLGIIGFAWIFLFTAYGSAANLQSSLNPDKGLGTAALSTIYASLVFSCLFIPPGMIKKLGLKWTIVICQCTYTLFIAANIFPRWYTLIPSAVILGLGAAPLWTAKCTYLTEIGGFYSKLSGENSEAVVNRFFGIFFAMFQSNQIWGNIISSTVLKAEPINNTNLSIVFNLQCGSKDCPGNPTINAKKPLLETIYILCGIYLAVAIISIVLLFFLLDNYSRRAATQNQNWFSISLLQITVKHLRNKYQLLIIPLTLWSGFEQAFLSADFTRSFVTCTRGIEYVGWTLICYGVCDAIGSYAFGFVVKYVGRVPCFLIAAAINYSMIILMMIWTPNPDQIYVLFIIPAFWGLGDAVWQTQINALYGVLFEKNKEAAFSNYRESIGFTIAYAYSSYACVYLKLILLLVYLTLGMLGYGVIEVMELLKEKSQAQVGTF